MMIMTTRSSASTTNCVQGILDGPGNPSNITLAGYLYFVNYREDCFEVYSDGTLIYDPFHVDFNLDWQDNLGELFSRKLFFYMCDIPVLEPSMLLRVTSYWTIFQLDSKIFVKYEDKITEAEHMDLEDFKLDSRVLFAGNKSMSIGEFMALYPYVSLTLSLEAIQLQSGEEFNEDLLTDYKYSRSKSRRRWKNTKSICDKLIKTRRMLEDANLGSRKKNTKRNLDKKMKTNHASKHIISCDITRNYYDKYIRTKTPVEISEMSRYEPMSLNSFARKVTSKISK